MIDAESVRGQIASMFPDTVTLRRHMHEHPELSFEEAATSRFIQDRLTEYGIPFRSGYAKHGIVATIEGTAEGQSRTVVLRADFDALPISEDPKHDCCSKVDGVMHACGHDFHTASLLTTARFMQEHRTEFCGRVVVIFQPGEECFPGGANLMLQEGALDGIEPDVVIGAHVLADMPVGHVGFCAGNYMASGDEVHLHVKGHGGHGGMPHLLNDTVLTACNLVVSMQQLVAREVPATVPVVLSFGKIVANGATNVIPDEVYIAGTLRTLSEEWRGRLKTRIRQVAEGVCQNFGCQCIVDIKDGYPSVYNDPAATQKAQFIASEMLGTDAVEQMKVRMTAEDFGYYTQRYPSVFYRFGVARTDGRPTGDAHTPQFDPNEEALRTSPAVMAWMALRFLQS